MLKKLKSMNEKKLAKKISNKVLRASQRDNSNYVKVVDGKLYLKTRDELTRKEFETLQKN